MAKVKVLDYRKIPSAEPKRMGKQDILRVIELEGGNRIAVRTPAEADTPEALKKAISSQLEERGKEIGREIEI